MTQLIHVIRLSILLLVFPNGLIGQQFSTVADLVENNPKIVLKKEVRNAAKALDDANDKVNGALKTAYENMRSSIFDKSQIPSRDFNETIVRGSIDLIFKWGKVLGYDSDAAEAVMSTIMFGYDLYQEEERYQQDVQKVVSANGIVDQINKQQEFLENGSLDERSAVEIIVKKLEKMPLGSEREAYLREIEEISSALRNKFKDFNEVYWMVYNNLLRGLYRSGIVHLRVKIDATDMLAFQFWEFSSIDRLANSFQEEEENGDIRFVLSGRGEGDKSLRDNIMSELNKLIKEGNRSVWDLKIPLEIVVSCTKHPYTMNYSVILNTKRRIPNVSAGQTLFLDGWIFDHKEKRAKVIGLANWPISYLKNHKLKYRLFSLD